MGAPEIVNLNSLLIKSLGAKKVIDVGVFTGASSLAAALALPDGKIRYVFNVIRQQHRFRWLGDRLRCE